MEVLFPASGTTLFSIMARHIGALSRQLAPTGALAEPTSITASGLKVTKVHEVLGPLVEGIDLKKPITSEMAKEFSRIWAIEGNGVLVFKKQKLTEQKLKNFAANFGTVMAHPFQNNTNAHHNKNNLAVKTASEGKTLAEDRVHGATRSLAAAYRACRSIVLACLPCLL